MQATVDDHKLKGIFLLVLACCFGIYAGIEYVYDYATLGAILTAMSVIVLLVGSHSLLGGKTRILRSTRWLTILLITAYSWIAANEKGAEGIYWVYSFPIAAFFLFRLMPSIILLFLYMPIALGIVINHADPINHHIILLTFSMISITALYVAVNRESDYKLLKQVIHTDLETGFQHPEKLEPNLTIEISRAEREGTGLLLMLLDIHHLVTKKQSKEATLHKLSAIVIDKLRAFDSCYRLRNNQLAIILPLSTLSDAHSIAKKLNKEFSEIEKTTTLKIGFASLNVSNTAQELINNAKESMNTYRGENVEGFND